MVVPGRDRGPMMNDSTQDPQGTPETDVTTTGGAQAASQQGAGEWPDAASDPGSGVPGGGRHKYASGKTYCGTEN